jgi:hypothetical protein
LPVAEVGVVDNHVSFVEALHVVFDVTSTVGLGLSLFMLIAELITSMTGVPALWVTVITWGAVPVAVKITVASRGEIVGFAFAINVTCALPLPIPGLTESHVPLFVELQDVFELMLMAAWLLASFARLIVVDEMDNDGLLAAWVTVMVCVEVPDALTRTYVVRVSVAGFA